MKTFLRNLSCKQLVLSLIVIFSFLCFLILTVWSNFRIRGLLDQQAANRWDAKEAAQVSAFFVRDVTVDEFQIKNFEHQLETALSEAAVVKEKENSRLYVDAYSSQGKITVVSELGTLEADAVGIGGDFFFFHPITLINGGYFSGNDLMKDSIILDEDAAWQLFGSNQIEGMSVMIGGVPHYVAGVVEREEGRFAKAAGLDDTLIYMSHESLSSYGSCSGINTYEVVAANPVKGFLYNTIKEKFGLKEHEMVVVENSARYSLESMIPVVLDFGLRSMQNAAVSYPYWENIARGHEDVTALVLVLQFIFLFVPTVIIFAAIIIKWRNRRPLMEGIKGLQIRRRGSV